MPLRDAYIWLQENVAELDAAEVIGLLKGLERVGFNRANEVLSYVVSIHSFLSTLVL
jgi:transcription initiation factor TFIIE subunit beta